MEPFGVDAIVTGSQGVEGGGLRGRRKYVSVVFSRPLKVNVNNWGFVGPKKGLASWIFDF
jgi:hypothetical protein